MSLHINKRMAGGPPEAVAAARDTAMHPSALDAFALAIGADTGPPAFLDLPGGRRPTWRSPKDAPRAS